MKSVDLQPGGRNTFRQLDRCARQQSGAAVEATMVGIRSGHEGCRASLDFTLRDLVGANASFRQLAFQSETGLNSEV